MDFCDQIETMSYCADTTNSRLINRLREKIDQVQSYFLGNIFCVCQLRQKAASFCVTVAVHFFRFLFSYFSAGDSDLGLSVTGG